MLPLALVDDWPLYAGLLLITAVVAVLIWIASLLVRLLTDGTANRAPMPEGKHLAAIEQHLEAMRQGQEGGLDLRRVEHLLVDLREQVTAANQHLLRLSEKVVAGGEHATRPWPLADRVVARLLSLGFERIELLTPDEDWAVLEQGDGEVLVEARRSGTLYKGRVGISAGKIGAENLRPAHSVFP